MRSTRLRRGRELLARPKLIFKRSKAFGRAKVVVKQALAKTSKAVWRVPLDREQTVRMLASYEVQVAKDGVLHLPNREPVAGDRPAQFGLREVTFEPESVWWMERDEEIRSLRIESSGNILLNKKYLLDTDFGSVQGVASLPLKQRNHDVDIAIAPWSHRWGRYYEFVVHILSKLCRIKETVDPSSWNAAKVCYPLHNKPYERQYLSLLGLGEDAVLDTREPIEPRSIIISNLQSSNRMLTPTRLASLRDAFVGEIQPPAGKRRMYLSRKGWKRHVLNENEVRRVVSSYGLEIIESMPTSVEEQIQLFSEASLIVAPHGAALTNLVWCSPGTHVIELFTRSYVMDMYSRISHVLGLRHTYLVDDAREPHHWTNLHKDMVVDIPSLDSALEIACT
jgi:hypothetical protein